MRRVIRCGSGRGRLVAPKLGPMGEEGWFAVSGGSAAPSIVAARLRPAGWRCVALRFAGAIAAATPSLGESARAGSRVASNISRCMGWIMFMVSVLEATQAPRLEPDRLDNVGGWGC